MINHLKLMLKTNQKKIKTFLKRKTVMNFKKNKKIELN